MIPVILKGDTSAKISLNVADGWDYTGVALDVEFCGVVKTFAEPVAGSVIDVVFAADETARFPLGTHKVIMTLRGEGGERSTLPWGKIKVTDAPAEVYDAAISVDPGTIAVEDATAADSLGDVKEKLNAVLDYLRRFAVSASSAVALAFALPCFGAGVQTATLNDIPGTAQVVTNVTLEGLATADAALLAIYYPEGNVTNVSQITTEGIEYAVGEDGNAYVKRGDISGDVVIPWKVTIDGEEYEVTAIKDGVFITSQIASIVAPITIKTVGRECFVNSRNLKSAYFPGIEATAYAMFAGSTIQKVSLPNVKVIASSTFEQCETLDSINIPLVETVGERAFRYTGISNLDIPFSVELGNYAFANCVFDHISLPEVRKIGQGAFANCTNLKSIYIPSVTEIGSEAFEEDGYLTIVDFGSSTKLKIPSLGSGAFNLNTFKFIIPIGMYDEWIAAPVWSDLYAAGYKFVGYADAAKVVTAPAVTNIARAVVNTVWDDKLGVAWEARMHDGALYYVAVTNRQEVAE